MIYPVQFLNEKQNLRDFMKKSVSPSEARKTISEWFNPQTPGEEVDQSSDLINTKMSEDGNPIS